MKKLLLVVLLAATLLLPSCTAQEPDNGKLNVVCTVFPQYDFVREIAGDAVELTMLVPLGTESHDFLLENVTVADLKTVATADLFIYIGGESDSHWVNELKRTVKDRGTTWMALTETTDTLDELMTDSMPDGEYDTDEHVWTSPKRALQITSAITDALCELDSANAPAYRENFEAYSAKLKALDDELTAVIASANSKTLVFADRFPFRYLCADYGLDVDAAFPGCSSSADPSVAQLTSLCETAVKTGAKAIFYMENSKTVYAERIAEQVGAKRMLLHSCHTVTKAEFSAGASYLSLMQENIKHLKEALS